MYHQLMDELTIIPSALNHTEFIGLVVLSLITSFITAAIGIGGGTIMLAVMAQLLPIKALVPVHGVVQLGSNGGRSLLMWRDIQANPTLWFLIGSLIGAIIGGSVVVQLPTNALKLILGLFILYSVWGPKPKNGVPSKYSFGLTGLISTALTMFVGATGPFVIAALKAFDFKPTSLVATSAACMLIQHLLKVVVFGVLGFAFGEYLTLVLLMIVSGFIGTMIGRKVLLKLDINRFQILVNTILSLLAIRLIYTGMMQIGS